MAYILPPPPPNPPHPPLIHPRKTRHIEEGDGLAKAKKKYRKATKPVTMDGKKLETEMFILLLLSYSTYYVWR